jgi:hypothetical protein
MGRQRCGRPRCSTTTAIGLTTSPPEGLMTGGCQAHYCASVLPKSAIANEG